MGKATIQDLDAAFAAVGAGVAGVNDATQAVADKKAIADDLHSKGAAADADENAALTGQVTAMQTLQEAYTKAGEVLAAFKAGT